MSQKTTPRWHRMRTPETRAVEKVLRKIFPGSDAYRYNSASIRVRIIDSRFAGKSAEERDELVEPLLAQLPEETQADIINLLTLSPGEPDESFKARFANEEFENPSRSML